jgi:hypothetical protein
MARTPKRIFHIESTNLSAAPPVGLNPGQIGLEIVPEAELGFLMWGGKDESDYTSKFLVKDQPAKVTWLGIGTVSPASLMSIFRADDESQPYITLKAENFPTSGNSYLDYFGQITSILGGSLPDGGLSIFGMSQVASASDTPGVRITGRFVDSGPNDTRPCVSITGEKTDSQLSLGYSETIFDVENVFSVVFTVRGSGNVGIGDVEPGVVKNDSNVGRYLTISAFSRDASAGELQSGDGGGYLECNTQNSGRDGCIIGGVAFTGSNLSQTNKRLSSIETAMQGSSNYGGIMHFYIKQTGVDDTSLTEALRIRETGDTIVYKNLGVGAEVPSGILHLSKDTSTDGQLGVNCNVGPSGSFYNSAPSVGMVEYRDTIIANGLGDPILNFGFTPAANMGLIGWLDISIYDTGNGASYYGHFSIRFFNEGAQSITKDYGDSTLLQLTDSGDGARLIFTNSGSPYFSPIFQIKTSNPFFDLNPYQIDYHLFLRKIFFPV